MTWLRNLPSWRSLLAWTAGTAVVIGIGALLFTLSGFYNVAASSKHYAFTRWFLELGMRRSVKFHSMGIEAPPSLDDQNLIKLGVGHYHGGCAPCHGAPGVKANPIVLSMLPAPPPLAPHIPNWTDAQLFWIVKHGIKYAGMPAWVAQKRDDEVWAVTAFLRKLPDVEAGDYERLARGNIETQSPTPVGQIATTGPTIFSITACLRCHDSADKLPTSNLVPRLSGQTREYLTHALKQYRSGERASGIMQPIATELDDGAIRSLAEYYANLNPAPGGQIETPPSPELIADGEALYETGSPSQKIPACVACHGSNRLPTYPNLAGQNAAYLKSQLELWRLGLRSDTPQSAMMAPIAKRLKEAQIEAVTAYLASLAVPTATRQAGN